jgi:hypothetical protein
MTDLLLDPDTGDLCILEGDLCTVTTEQELTRQAVMVTLRTFRGEWFRNISTGVPWIENENNKIALLGKVSKDFVDSQIRLAIKSLPEVLGISNYSTKFNQQTGLMSLTANILSAGGTISLVNETFDINT